MTTNALIAPSNPTSTEELPRMTSPINVPMAMARPEARGLLVTIPRFSADIGGAFEQEVSATGPSGN